MKKGTIAGRGTTATIPFTPLSGLGLLFWVDFRERFQRRFTRIFKTIRSINSLSLGRGTAVLSPFHKPFSFVFQFNGASYAPFVETECNNEGTHDGANLTQDLAQLTQAKKGGWANV